MPRYEITAPDGQRFEVTAPDGATQDQVMQYAKSQWKSDPKSRFDAALKEEQERQMGEMSGVQKFFAGAGKGFSDIGTGIAQIFGNETAKSIDEERRLAAPLVNTGAGKVGEVIGSVAAAAPMMAIPGANTAAGAALTGAALGGLQPVGTGESRAQNAAVGAALGGGSQYVLGKGAQLAGNRLANVEASEAARQAQNAVKDAGIAEARGAGYMTVPSVSNSGFMGRAVEGLTGKEKAKQLAAVKNQPITDALVRKGLGLADDAPLTHETMKNVRAEAAAKGYEPVRQIPQMETDAIFQKQVSALTSRSDNAAKDFGALVESDIKPLADGLKQIKSFSGDTAVDAIAVLREKSSDLYAQGNKTLGKAYRQAAEAVEAQIERGLAKSGKNGQQLLKDYRGARVRMAQTFDVEKALREGQGSVDARVLGKMFEKNPDRLTGELRQVGKAAAAMPDVMAVPKDGWANPFTALDSGLATFGGILAGNPAPLAYPVARAAARYGLMSKPGQKALTGPSYGPGALTRLTPRMLEEMEKRGAGGLLGLVDLSQ